MINKSNILLRILLFIIIVLILTGLSLEFSIELIPHGLFLLVGLAILTGGLTIIFRGSNGHNKLLVINKILLFASLTSLLLFFVIGRIQNTITKRNADLINEKLENFKMKNGTYPDKLEKMKPEYFESIPKVKIGLHSSDFIYDFKMDTSHRFRYFKSINSDRDFNYWLGYYGYLGTEAFYNSKDRIWTFDD